MKPMEEEPSATKSIVEDKQTDDSESSSPTFNEEVDETPNETKLSTATPSDSNKLIDTNESDVQSTTLPVVDEASIQDKMPLEITQDPSSLAVTPVEESETDLSAAQSTHDNDGSMPDKIPSNQPQKGSKTSETKLLVTSSETDKKMSEAILKTLDESKEESPTKDGNNSPNQSQNSKNSKPVRRSKKLNVLSKAKTALVMDVSDIADKTLKKNSKLKFKPKNIKITPINKINEGTNADEKNETSVTATKKTTLKIVSKTAANLNLENDDVERNDESEDFLTEKMDTALESTPPEESKGRGRKKQQTLGTDQPMFVDERLPEGWSRSLIQRQLGASAGKWDMYLLSPQGKRFRSRNELRKYISNNNLDIDADDFDFSVFGKNLDESQSKAQPGPESSKKAVKRKSISTPKATSNITPKVKRIRKAKPQATSPEDRSHECELSDDATDVQDFSVSPYFMCEKPKKTIRVNQTKPVIGLQKWSPPRSPYNLIQENLFHNPWQLLVATILLNKSSGKAASPIIYEFIRRWSTPDEIKSATLAEISHLIKPLGLHTKRAATIKRFSDEFVNMKWYYPNELHGIGKYGNDSYKMFCVDEWQSVRPTDAMLLMYKNWMDCNWKELCCNTNNCLKF